MNFVTKWDLLLFDSLFRGEFWIKFSGFWIPIFEFFGKFIFDFFILIHFFFYFNFFLFGFFFFFFPIFAFLLYFTIFPLFTLHFTAAPVILIIVRPLLSSLPLPLRLSHLLHHFPPFTSSGIASIPRPTRAPHSNSCRQEFSAFILAAAPSPNVQQNSN